MIAGIGYRIGMIGNRIGVGGGDNKPLLIAFDDGFFITFDDGFFISF